jgi:hypothetical protein
LSATLRAFGPRFQLCGLSVLRLAFGLLAVVGNGGSQLVTLQGIRFQFDFVEGIMLIWS